MTQTPHLRWAVFWLIVNEKNEVLMLQRQNTWYYDGGYCLPSGHIEPHELASEAIVRELKEEINIEVTQEDVKLFSVIQRMTGGENGREYFDLCYLVASRKGEIANAEPEKCKQLSWFTPKTLPEFAPYENIYFSNLYYETWWSQLTFWEMDLRERSHRKK